MRKFLGYVLSTIIGLVGGAVIAIGTEQFYGDTLRKTFAEWAVTSAAMQPSDWEALVRVVVLGVLWVAVGVLLLLHIGMLLLAILAAAINWKDRDEPGWLMSVAGLVGFGGGSAAAALTLRIVGPGLMGTGLATLLLCVFGLVTVLVIFWIHDRDDFLQAQIDDRVTARRQEAERIAELAAMEQEAREQRAARARDIAAVRESVAKKVRAQNAARDAAIIRRINQTVARGSAEVVEQVMSRINGPETRPRRGRSGARPRRPLRRHRGPGPGATD